MIYFNANVVVFDIDDDIDVNVVVVAVIVAIVVFINNIIDVIIVAR